MLLVPAWLTLRTVQIPRPLIPVEGNPTPLGYTWSLLLFVIPVLVIGGKVIRLRESAVEKRAFGLTIALLIPLGIGLDVLFGMSFFTFVNKAATLGWNLPGYVWGQGFENAIPIEEFAFYGSGFVAILLTYVWSDQVWMKAYSAREPAQPRQRLIRHERWHRVMLTARHMAQRGAELFVSSPLRVDPGVDLGLRGGGGVFRRFTGIVGGARAFVRDSSFPFSPQGARPPSFVL